MITVVAALIKRDGRLLICQRRKGDAFELKWEFPGGKIHVGETLGAALARELTEELGAPAVIGREIYRTRHRYAQQNCTVELIFFGAELEAAPQNLAFEQILWAPQEELLEYDFLAGDRELIELLAAGKLLL